MDLQMGSALMDRSNANLSIDAALASLRGQYAKANPQSRLMNEQAQAFLPGGNTRSVLHFDPFPLTMQRGKGAEVWDVTTISISSESFRLAYMAIATRSSRQP
jgi:hypothetical protein